MWSDDKTETQSSAGLPSYTNSVKTRSARAVYRRVRKVLWLQWRGITIVVFILVDVVFFSVAFIYLNAVETHVTTDLEAAMPFLGCLMTKERKECFALGQELFINEDTVIAVLMMLSVSHRSFRSHSEHILMVPTDCRYTMLYSSRTIRHVPCVAGVLSLEVQLETRICLPRCKTVRGCGCQELRVGQHRPKSDKIT